MKTKRHEQLEDLLEDETEAQRNKWLDQGDQEERRVEETNNSSPKCHTSSESRADDE